MVADVRLLPQQSVAFQIRRAHLAFDRLLTMRLARHGVKAGYWHYFRALWIHESLTQRQLSEITGVTETTSVALLKGMAKEGYVERERDAADKRKVNVRLTRKGKALERRLLPYAVELNELAIQGVNHASVRANLEILRQVAANLEAAFEREV